MAKVSYANLKLKTDNSVSTFKFKDQDIEVLNYLPISDKYDLIMITLQKADEEGIFNPVKLNMYFELNLVYMYTNLSFTDKQREDETKIYDNLKSNGFIDLFLETLNKDEFDDLFELINETMENYSKYRNTAAALIQSLITDLPKNAEVAKEIVENFDPEKYGQVVAFAEKANGGRPIK